METKKIKLDIVGGKTESSNEEMEVDVKEGQEPQTPTNTPPQTPTDTPPETPPENPVVDESSALEAPEVIENSDSNSKDKKIQKRRNEQERRKGIFNAMLGEENLTFPITSIGKNLKETISKTLSKKIEGKCNGEGFVKSDSVKVINYSSGILLGGDIKYKILYEAFVTNPVEGHLINCTVKNVTKAGIRAQVIDGNDIPLIIFIARDHHHTNRYFLSIKEEDKIMTRVVGTRFELNDTYISIIGELVEPKNYKGKGGKKPKLIIRE